MKGVNIFLAEGFEDIEALAANDVLRRGGIRTRLITISEEPFVVSSHGVMIGVDEFFSEMPVSHEGTNQNDVMIFPGGMPGTKNLAACRPLVKAMKDHYASGGTVAAICAAPGLMLGQLDDWEGKIFTCYDGFEDKPSAKGALFVPKPAVTDGRIITGRGPAYAVEFGLEILKYLKGDSAAEEVRKGMFIE